MEHQISSLRTEKVEASNIGLVWEKVENLIIGLKGKVASFCSEWGGIWTRDSVEGGSSFGV